MKKRSLKKSVRHMCGGIAGECVLANELIKGIDKAKIEEALVDVADLQDASLSLISVSFDRAPRDFGSPAEYRKARRQYYRAAYTRFVKEFEEHLNAIVSKMNSAMPASKTTEK